MSDGFSATCTDAFNLLCGSLLGEGAYRKVFTCKLRDDLVVKVEDQEAREFHNALELHFWNDNQYCEGVAKWLAPCEFISPDGRLLLQKRVERLPADYKLPEKVPAFLTDLKRSNYGLLDGRLVCVDYAGAIRNPSTRLKKADWWEPMG